jgi:iron(III) transport system permease protein
MSYSGRAAARKGRQETARVGLPAPRSIILVAAIVAAAMSVPLVYIFIRGLGAPPATWATLWSTRLPALLWSTVSLAALSTAIAATVGVTMALLVERTDLPGRAVWRWLLAVPLVVPPYVGALTYIAVFRPGGMFQGWMAGLLGVSRYELIGWPSIYGFLGTAVLLSFYTYPYVYILASAALRSSSRHLEEAARTTGAGPLEVLRRVTLPLLRPTIAAGSLLAALYAISDFGTVTLMRYPTFTEAIFRQLNARFDRNGAAVLSVVLVILTLVLLYLEGRVRGRGRYDQIGGRWRPMEMAALGRWRPVALIAVGVVIAATLAFPLAVLVGWTVEGFTTSHSSAAMLRLDALRVPGYALNSAVASAVAATIAVVCVFPLGYLAARHPRSGRLLGILARSGYGLPGIVIGLSMVFVFNSLLPVLYGTVVALVAAYLVRFLPQALQAVETSIGGVTGSLEEAGRSLGRGAGRTTWDVTAPLVRPGLIAGWALVFLSSMKELPASLLLRPIGFDTLAVRVWIPAAEGFFAQAAPAALAIIVVSIGPLLYLIFRSKGGLDQLS